MSSITSRRKAGNGVSFILYLIRSENGLVKIGIASNVEERLQTLNIGSPVELELIYTIYSVFAKEIESNLHSKYKSQRVKGEWYLLSDEDIRDIEAKYGESGTVSSYDPWREYLHG